MRDKHGELMFKQDIHKRDSVQTGSTKMSEKPESSMLPMMVDDQCSGGRPTIIIIMHTYTCVIKYRYFPSNGFNSFDIY